VTISQRHFERGQISTICCGSGERDHIFWKDLGHPTDASRYNIQAGTRGFKYRNTESLREGSIQKDRALLKNLRSGEFEPQDDINMINPYRGHVSVGHRAEQSDPILQEVGLPHLEEVNHLGSVAT
jgi:hypothetical protein